MTETATANDTTQEPQVKLCTHCRQKRPINEFRRRSKTSDERQCQCRECRNREERERRVAKTQKTFVKYARKVNRADCDPFVVVAVTCELTKHFGGVDKFCARFVGAMEDAEAARNHSAVSTFLATVLNLSLVSNQLIQRGRDQQCEYVNDDDLKRAAQKTSSNWFARIPNWRCGQRVSSRSGELSRRAKLLRR